MCMKLQTIVASVLLVSVVSALKFDLSSSKVKCFSDDIPDSTLVLGKYNVEVLGTVDPNLEHSPVNMQVTDPMEKVLVQRDNITSGTFVFTTGIAGDYIVCFHNMAPVSDELVKRITLDLKHGVDAQDYSKLMKAEHLTPLQKRREESMRDLTEHTCERVMWFAILTIVVLVGTSVAQSVYLRSYLRRKKII